MFNTTVKNPTLKILVSKDLILEEDPEDIERVLKEIEAKEKRLAEVTK